MNGLWRKIWFRLRWIFGVDPEVVSDPSCPTCGPSFGGECGQADASCEEIIADGAVLEARYDYIYTKNKYKPAPPRQKELCDPPGRTGDLLTNTGNRCKYEGEVRHYKGKTVVCLQCQGCGGGGGQGSGNQSASARLDASRIPSGKCMYEGTCPEIDCGYWYEVNKARRVIPQSTVEISGRNKRNRSVQSADNQGNASLATAPPGGGTGNNTPDSSPCTPELIYAEDGCTVIGIKPVLLARGTLAYWESSEIYPLTKDCDGNYIYGDDAGKPIRHHKMPNRALEPHFLSRQTGVVSYVDPGNVEWGNTYARFIQLEISNVDIEGFRQAADKPLSETEPLTVTIMPRTEATKSVRASGLFINTFKTNIHGEEFAVPKNGVNSLEYFDRHTYYGGNDTHRGGENMDVGAMVFHSPDTQFDRPPLDVTEAKLELNMFGKGMMYGHCAEGEDPESAFKSKYNQKGARGAINLSKYVAAQGDDQAVNRCIVGAAYAPADRVTDKGDNFTYPLLQLMRESSVYIEVDGPQQPLRVTKTNETSESNNGHPGRPLGHDRTSDYSWLGSQLHHEKPIHDGSAYYGNIKTFIPNQYGGLTNATYHDFYPLTSDELKQDVIGINNGDSYINLHHIVRKAFVSDKIMEDISPLIQKGGISGERAGFMQGLLRRIFEDIGLEECATCPEDADPTDPRNAFNGIGIRDSFTSRPWTGVGPPPPANPGSDIFWPNLLKYQVTYAVESDVNLYYRATNDSDAGEIYYRKLKDKNYDSSFPKDSPWELGFLNRFYVTSNENPKWKMILRVIFNLLWTYGVGVYLIIYGMASAVNSFSKLNISWTNFNIGGLAGAIILAVIVAFGVGWIIFWSNRDSDNKFWDSVLGIDGCFPDITSSENTEGSRFRIRDGRVRQFEDNYYKYNWDYSRQNTIAVTLGLPDPYSTCDCPNDLSYEILYSNKQNPTSMTDAYRNFQANSYIDIPSHSGPIQKMFRLGNKVFVQTTDGMFSLQTGASQMNTQDGRSVYLEAATTLQVPVEIFGGTEEGRGGTLDPNAGRVTPWGYLWPDSESRSWNLFDGQSNIVLGDYGMRKFLDLFMPFNATDRVRDEKTPDGIGYNIGVDHARSIVFLSKQDWTDDGKPNHWTLSFDMKSKAWIGFEYFCPPLYVWDRHRMWSFNGEDMWMHNKRGEFQTVYGEPVPMVIDFVIKDKKTLDAFAMNNIEIDAEFDRQEKGSFVRLSEEFFTEIGVHNSWQSSGLLPTLNMEDQDAQEQLQNDINILPIKRLHGSKWRFDRIHDRVETRDQALMTSRDDGFFTEFNASIIGQAREANYFIDNYLVVRLMYDGSTSTRVLLKNVQTKVNPEKL